MTPAESLAVIAAVTDQIRDQYMHYTTLAATFDKLALTPEQVRLVVDEAKGKRTRAQAVIDTGEDVELVVMITMLAVAIDAFVAKVEAP